MQILLYSIGSVVIVSCISIVGLITFVVSTRKLQDLLLFLVSFATGAIFGDVFFHLLPEIVEQYNFGINISVSFLAGIMLSFIIEKVIQWRHCHVEIDSSEHIHPFAIMNLYGDGIHNFVDGLSIGASYLISIPTGIATTLAIIFHEIPQEFGDFAVLIKGGFSKTKALVFNIITGFIAVFGTLLAFILNNSISNAASFLVPFAAGNLIYIAGSDLIPELHKVVAFRKSMIQLIALVSGIGVMYLLLQITE